MTVSINLVQKKTLGMWRWIAILAGVLFLLLVILLFESYETRSNLQANEEELLIRRAQVIEQTEMRNERQGLHTSEELINAVTWLEKERVDITAFLSELTALLPQRGYITSLQLSNRNELEVIVQFDMQREAAYFLHALKQAEWTKEAFIQTINEQQNTDGQSAQYEASYSFTFDASYFSILEEAER